MTAFSLVADLVRRGAILSVDGGSLNVKAPRGAVTQADRAALAEHKTEVLALISESPAWRLRSASLQCEFARATRQPLTDAEVAECDAIAREELEARS